jgi:hypothetical protein
MFSDVDNVPMMSGDIVMFTTRDGCQDLFTRHVGRPSLCTKTP